VRLVLRAVVALSLLGAAVIHAVQVPSHLEEWRAAGITFVVLAAGQAALGLVLAVRADRRLFLLAQGVSLATIGLWLVSRTGGLPIGPEPGEPEPVGRADLTATVLEVATVLAAILLRRARRATAAHRPGAVAVVAMAAGLAAAVTWYGLQPTSVCDNHDDGQAPFGPLTPVEGHSLLPAATPPATAVPGQRVGLVVGLLRNCATGPITMHSARLLNVAGQSHAVVPGRFWVASIPPSRPGIVLAAGQLATAKPLPGRVRVEPTPDQATRALVLELRTVHPGGFRVNALTIAYRSGRHSYTAPFPTNAQLTIGTQTAS
jgi:hypothetical protein